MTAAVAYDPVLPSQGYKRSKGFQMRPSRLRCAGLSSGAVTLTE